jgi:hypothetical protein
MSSHVQSSLHMQSPAPAGGSSGLALPPHGQEVLPAHWQVERSQMREAGSMLEMQVEQLRAENAALQLAQQQAAAAAAAAQARQATGSRPGPKGPTPPEFSGSKQSLHGREVDAFIRDMEKCMSYYASNYPTEESKVKYAALFLKGAAAEWWDALDKSDGVEDDWYMFTERLRERYRPMVAAEVARKQLYQLKQTGSMSAYCDIFLKVLTPVQDMSDADQVFLFLNGLKRLDVANEVRKAQPASLNSAMKEAVRADAFHSGSRQPGYFGRGGSNPAGTSPMDLHALDAILDDGNNGGETNEEANHDANPRQDAYSLQEMLNRMQALEHRLAAVSSSKPFGGSKKSGAGGGRDRVPGLSAADVAQLRAEGKCFRCKKPGHLKRECPLLSGKPNFQ